MKILRGIVQLLFLGGVTALLIRGLMGLTTVNCEYYCPFGGVVALYPLLRYKAYTCALTEFNTALLVSVLVLALASKKSFCSWVCPIGTLQEWLGWVGKKVFRRRFLLPMSLDRVLVYLRYVVLIAVPVLTFTAWKYDLGFRAFDPFYILFTWGGHGTAAFSIWIVLVVLGAALFVPFLWCRYLCPMGAALDPFSRVGALRLKRNRSVCTDCGICDKVCPHRIPVSLVDEVTAMNCTNCLDCVEKCPSKGALELTWFGK